MASDSWLSSLPRGGNKTVHVGWLSEPSGGFVTASKRNWVRCRPSLPDFKSYPLGKRVPIDARRRRDVLHVGLQVNIGEPATTEVNSTLIFHFIFHLNSPATRQEE